MKKLGIMLSVAVATAGVQINQASAEGFVCGSGDLNLRIYHHTGKNGPTGKVAVMVFSDPQLKSNEGNRTIARFFGEATKGDMKGKDASAFSQGLGSKKGWFYRAHIDQRKTKSQYLNDQILGAKLKSYEDILINLDFVRNGTIKNNNAVSGKLIAVKYQNEAGIYEFTTRELQCKRYLKTDPEDVSDSDQAYQQQVQQHQQVQD